MNIKVVVEFAVAALIAIGILVGILIAIQADMSRTLYIILDENIDIRKIMMKQYIATKILFKNKYEIDIDEYEELYNSSIDANYKNKISNNNEI